MNSSKKYLYVGVVALLVVIGVSLAYFGIKIIGNDTAKGNKVVTGNLELTFTDTNEITLNDAFPGDSFRKTISVKNTGTKDVSYSLVWTELTNGIINNELVIEATCKRLNSSGTEEGTCEAISQTPIKSNTIKKNISIEPSITHEYTIKVTFIDTGSVQNYNKNKTFEGKLGITESSVKTVYCTYDGELTQGAEYVNGQYTYKYMQEGGYDGLGQVWQDITSDGWGVQLTDIASTDAVTSEVCTYINNKPITSMSYMFYKSQATTLDISNFNTSNVTDMSSMFGNSEATTLDVSNFDTSNVTNMNSMFLNSQAATLDLSNFDTSNVKNMSSMFWNSKATNLKTIYGSSKFVTTAVTSSTNMFYGCTKLIGGAGTKYDSTKTDKTYARIDGGTSNPGYFTDVADKDIPEPNSFSTDSWKTIAKAARTNNTGKYNVGDTRTIDMGTYGTHTLRLANKTTPSECSTSGFSQSACGFAIEFADIITNYNMNPAGTYKGTTYRYGWNVDGWPASEMYTFVNTDIYNSLPSDLKNVIINTTTVSSHGGGDTSNFTSTDKLYLLALKEIYTNFSSSSDVSYDTAQNLTRTLDYYTVKGITTNYYSGAIKKSKTAAEPWWLRSAYSDTNYHFGLVTSEGKWISTDSHYASGVSPAFRIG